jgi:hypothetical protein
MARIMQIFSPQAGTRFAGQCMGQQPVPGRANESLRTACGIRNQRKQLVLPAISHQLQRRIKMRHLNLKMLGIAVALVLLASVSCSSKPEGETAQSKQPTEQDSSAMAKSQQEPSAAPAESAKSQETSPQSDTVVVTGKVENGPQGIIVSADNGSYAVSGQDLSDKIGMTVKITGTLKEFEGSRTIEVTNVEIVQ